MNLGNTLRRIRQRKELSLRRLEELSGVPFQTIHRVETGRVTNPSVFTIEALSKALRVDIMRLYRSSK